MDFYAGSSTKILDCNILTHRVEWAPWNFHTNKISVYTNFWPHLWPWHRQASHGVIEKAYGALCHSLIIHSPLVLIVPLFCHMVPGLKWRCIIITSFWRCISQLLLCSAISPQATCVTALELYKNERFSLIITLMDIITVHIFDSNITMGHMWMEYIQIWSNY